VRTALTVICLTAVLALGTGSAFAAIPPDPQPPAAGPHNAPLVIHDLHTVVRERDAGRTLSTILAGAAILIACGSAGLSIARRPLRPTT
jgi:hypothetical protein